jgi:hypothetical protein
MSYGPDLVEHYSGAAPYVDKILKGTKAGDLPVQRPTKFELAINMKTAKALGIKIHNSIMVRADKVIERVSGFPRFTTGRRLLCLNLVTKVIAPSRYVLRSAARWIIWSNRQPT